MSKINTVSLKDEYRELLEVDGKFCAKENGIKRRGWGQFLQAPLLLNPVGYATA